MKDHIGYDIIIENAMRDVVYRVLKKVEKEGLKNEHHFVISFSTKSFGVVLSDVLKARFPSEMTVIIQHQFRSLVVAENYFKITLTFSGVSEELTIPYRSIVSFADPSVNFGLKFNNNEDLEQAEEVLQELEDLKIDNSDLSGKIVSLADFKKNRDKNN